MKKVIYGLLALSISFIVYAGGNPEFVHFPEGYKSTFTHYDTRNRNNGKQVAVMYANKIAIDSASESALADGSKIIMEIYKTVPGDDGKPAVGADGIFKKGKFAAVAVMEKRSDWNADFDAKQRAGDWGLAIYKTDGSPKENALDCASCHIPLKASDNLFSHSSLVEFAK